jgi:hypothetical protein
MAKRHYVVGLPVAVTVHPDGRVTFDVDLAEVTDFIEHVEGDIDDTVEADISTVSDAAGRVGNVLTTTIHPARPTNAQEAS